MVLDPTKIQRFAKDFKKVPKELKEFYDLAEEHRGACVFQVASKHHPEYVVAGTWVELRGLYVPRSEQDGVFKQLSDLFIDIRDRANDEIKYL